MPATAPTLTLNNGIEMPALGLGVFQTPPPEAEEPLRAARELFASLGFKPALAAVDGLLGSPAAAAL